MIKTLSIAASALALALAGSASAAITVTKVTNLKTYTVMGDTFAIPHGNQLIEDFDHINKISISGNGSTYKGNTYVGKTEVTAEPTGDSSTYFAVKKGQTETFTLPYTFTGVGLLISTPDTFNSISFYNGSTFLGTVQGTQFGGLTTETSKNQDPTAYYEFSAPAITKFTVTSSTNSFEFDNVSVSGAPEPATWAMMFVGVAMVGGALRLRRRDTTAFAAAA